ncbi:cobalamin biosynthesis protein CbiM [Clostridiales bacterium PH28_bin88]|nr:cobalamin biosynthesis protein CbiM [Clostridiales bacterium PH28_bin88]
MHIPDGYISPQTAVTLGAAMVPVWGVASRKVKASLKARQVPLMAIGAAFSFTIMMYNIPVPDGTTAHAAGGTLMAIILGPWAASIGVSIALAIQALFFGDGGIWAFGTNAFNLAFVMPFSGYFIYRLISGRSPINCRRRWIAAAVAGFVSMNLAALAAAIQFGIQPVLFQSADGTPLYSPYPLSMAIPAMAFAHLLIAGPVEGAVTGLVVRYLQKHNQGLLQLNSPIQVRYADTVAKNYTKLWWGLAVMVVLAPLGLLANGSAWGEWSREEVLGMVGFLPEGMKALAATWSHALFPDYTVPGWGDGFFQSAAGYIVSAAGGLALILAVVFLGARLLVGKGKVHE